MDLYEFIRLVSNRYPLCPDRMTPDHRGILSRTHLFSVLSDEYEICGMLCVSLPLTLLVSYYVSSCHYATTPIRQSYLLFCFVPLISVFPLATTASAGFPLWRLLALNYFWIRKRIEAGRRCIRIFHLPLWNSCGPDSQSPPILVVLPIQLSLYHINRFVALGTSQWSDCYSEFLDYPSSEIWHYDVPKDFGRTLFGSNLRHAHTQSSDLASYKVACKLGTSGPCGSFRNSFLPTALVEVLSFATHWSNERVPRHDTVTRMELLSV